MKFKYVMEFADGEKVNSTSFDTFEDCYLALPFNWDIYEGKIGGSKEDDIKYGSLYFQFNTGIDCYDDLDCYQVYDGSMPELVALIPISLHVVDISIVKVL